MTLIYECSNGTKFDLMKSPIFAQDPENLAATDWKYSITAAPGIKPKVRKIYRSAKDCSLTVAVFADDADEFNDIMTRLHEAFEVDVRAETPGKIWWNDYYRQVYIMASSHAEFDENFESVEETLTVLAASQYWLRPTAKEYRAAASTDTEEWLDYDFDYEFNYHKSQTNLTFRNDSMFESDFMLTIYGPCTNPSITINGAQYALTVTLAAGERIAVDSVLQKIRKTSARGVETNAFSCWTDKSNYIFTKIPAGQVLIGWSALFDFDLTVYAERNTPPWI